MRYSSLFIISIAGFLCALTGHAQTFQRYEFAEPKMGTTFRIVCYAEEPVPVEAVAQAAFDRIDELNLIFSDYREDSEVSRLSQAAGSKQKIPLSPELLEVLIFSRRLSKVTGGAFDVTIGPLSKLWRRAFRQMEFPELSDIAEARALVDFRQLRLFRKRSRARLQKTGMRLDLGGIAKGYTVDAVYQVLRDHGITRALVDGGGDIYAGAPPPGQPGWEVSLLSGHEASSSSEPHKIVLRDRAIASSGSTYQFLEWQGVRYSHIIDPRTGLGITETDIINVAAENCMQADALASALSILNDLERTQLLDRFPNAALINSNE